MKAARRLPKLQQPQSLLAYLRQFLTPQVWKQARAAVPGPHSAALGPAALGVGRPGHDLGGWRLPSREVRDRTRILRGRL